MFLKRSSMKTCCKFIGGFGSILIFLPIIFQMSRTSLMYLCAFNWRNREFYYVGCFLFKSSLPFKSNLLFHIRMRRKLVRESIDTARYKISRSQRICNIWNAFSFYGLCFTNNCFRSILKFYVGL